MREWLDELEEQEPIKAQSVAAALARVLADRGTDVCGTDWGVNLGGDLYEFRIRHTETAIKKMLPTPEEAARAQAADNAGQAHDPPADRQAKILLRIFFTTYGQHVALLCSGYDKGKDPKPKRQQAEIAAARTMAATARANLRARQRAEAPHKPT